MRARPLSLFTIIRARNKVLTFKPSQCRKGPFTTLSGKFAKGLKYESKSQNNLYYNYTNSSILIVNTI